MVALGLDGIDGWRNANRTNRPSFHVVRDSLTQNKIRMVCHLTHAGDERKDIGVVVLYQYVSEYKYSRRKKTYQNHSLCDIVIEPTLSVAVNGIIEVHLFLTELIASNFNDLWRQPQILFTLRLSAS